MATYIEPWTCYHFLKEASSVGKLRHLKEILLCFRFNIIFPDTILKTAFYISHRNEKANEKWPNV